MEMIYESEICVQSQNLVIRKTSLNLFIPVGAHFIRILCVKNSQKGMVLENNNFLPFLTKLTFNATWLKLSTYQPLKHVIMFGLDAKMEEMFCGLFLGK